MDALGIDTRAKPIVAIRKPMRKPSTKEFMRLSSKYLGYGFLCMLLVGCGGGGGKDHSVQFGGEWNVDVHFSANGCPSSVPILQIWNMSMTFLRHQILRFEMQC